MKKTEEDILNDLIDNAGLIAETAENITGSGYDTLAALAIALGRACFVNNTDIKTTFGMVEDGYKIQKEVSKPAVVKDAINIPEETPVNKLMN